LVPGSLHHEQDVADAGAVHRGSQPLGTVLRRPDGVDGQQMLDIGAGVTAGLRAGLEADVNDPRLGRSMRAWWLSALGRRRDASRRCGTTAAMCSVRSGSCP
jgi:hypothetical protein